VVGAVVQVLVAEHAAPSFFAQTLPRFLAITVHTTRIYLTLVASGSRPARVTSAKEKRKKHEFLAIRYNDAAGILIMVWWAILDIWVEVVVAR